MKKSKKKNSGVKSSNKAPKLYISRNFLAEFFGISKSTLLFAVAETNDDECGVIITPIVAILGDQKFVSLTHGHIQTTALAQGLKQSLYPAIVCYDHTTETFTFKSSVGSQASITRATLEKHFGKGVMTTKGY